MYLQSICIPIPLLFLIGFQNHRECDLNSLQIARPKSSNSSNRGQWIQIPFAQNSADCASRGMLTSNLLNLNSDEMDRAGCLLIPFIFRSKKSTQHLQILRIQKKQIFSRTTAAHGTTSKIYSSFDASVFLNWCRFCRSVRNESSQEAWEKQFKSYFVVFMKMASKDVHLEITCDLSTDTFIAALKRFQSTRGICSEIALIRAENTPSFKWSLTGVVKLHPGKDNLVRVVRLKFANQSEVTCNTL